MALSSEYRTYNLKVRTLTIKVNLVDGFNSIFSEKGKHFNYQPTNALT